MWLFFDPTRGVTPWSGSRTQSSIVSQLNTIYILFSLLSHCLLYFLSSNLYLFSFILCLYFQPCLGNYLSMDGGENYVFGLNHEA